jgi:serine/threonine protein kinase
MFKFLGKQEDAAADDLVVPVDEKFLKETEERIDGLKGSKTDDYEIKEILGTGSFGKVRLVRHKATGFVYAMKQLSKSVILRTKQLEHMMAEKNILAALRFPFIVQFYGSLQDERHLYLVLQYVIGGEFFTHLRSANRFPNDTARFYAAAVVLGFEHLHDQNIIFRDLKPENLLLDNLGYVKITDFGFAKRIDPTVKTWTLCGTPEYLAPEIILNKGHGKAVDWWACGVLMYEMLVGYPPFYSEDRMALYQNILSGKVDYPRHVSRQARDLISKLLTADLTRRLGTLRHGSKDIRRHPWFRGFDWNALMHKKIQAPIVPHAQSEDDTSYFDEYPEEDEEETPPIHASEQELFRDF